MFSGIVIWEARIMAREGGKFCVENILGEIPKIGESIAHNGVCTTITLANKKYYEFFAVQETLDRSNLASLKQGDSVHVERSLRWWDSISGQFLSGHVDACLLVKRREVMSDTSLCLEVSLPKKWQNHIVEKGWIGIDGVSLTVSSEKTWSFEVVIVPHTQEITHIGRLQKRDLVNIEFDLMAKYLANFLRERVWRWGKKK